MSPKEKKVKKIKKKKVEESKEEIKKKECAPSWRKENRNLKGNNKVYLPLIRVFPTAKSFWLKRKKT